jgi:prepilin-type N-terminal cleavage/methylation domain-containing protein
LRRHAGLPPGIARIPLIPLNRCEWRELDCLLRSTCVPLKSAGFSLIEVVVATAVVTLGAASLAQLFVISARANRLANDASMTMLMAEEKMEQLRLDADGPSPPDALSANEEGYFDSLDAGGRSLGGGPPPSGAAYLRRWSVEPVSSRPGSAVVLQVLVVPASVQGRGGSGGRAGTVPGGTRLIGVSVPRAD